MDELVTQLLSHIKGIWKYRWYAVATMWVVAIAGWIAVSMLPDRYESSARVYVDTESVLKPLMAGMALPPNLEQQVIIMSRTLISRPNVERVMRMIDLDIRAKTTTDREQLINDLTDDIKIAATGRDNLFTITYENEDPKVAQGVVQSLLTIFVEGSIGDKKDEADSAIRFIDEQIKAYEEKLVAAEIALKQFKQKNMGMMSGQGGDFVSQLSAASDSVNQARLELREAEQSRDAIKSQIANYEPDVAPEKPKARVAPTPEIDARIETLNKNLDAMRLNFTEEHPDVISTKRLIAALEKRKVDEAKLIEPSIESEKSYSPMLQQLNITLADAEARVAAMRARVDEYANRYSRLRSMSYAVPEVEADCPPIRAARRAASSGAARTAPPWRKVVAAAGGCRQRPQAGQEPAEPALVEVGDLLRRADAGALPLQPLEAVGRPRRQPLLLRMHHVQQERRRSAGAGRAGRRRTGPPGPPPGSR